MVKSKYPKYISGFDFVMEEDTNASTYELAPIYLKKLELEK